MPENAHILGLGTAAPARSIAQEDSLAAARALSHLNGQERLLPILYRRTNIARRGSVLLRDDGGHDLFGPARDADDRGPTTAARLERYRALAPDLAIAAAARALENARTRPDEITHLVTASCTGFNAPGVDWHLMQRLGLAPTTLRTHIGFMGCHAAINALRVAAAFCSVPAAGSRPSARAAGARAPAIGTLVPAPETHAPAIGTPVPAPETHAPGDGTRAPTPGMRVRTARTRVREAGTHIPGPSAGDGSAETAGFRGLPVHPRVLVCCVEVCTIHYSYDQNPDRLVANAIFADGAAAAVLAPGFGAGVGRASENPAPLSVLSTASALLPDSAGAMSWSVGDHGFEMSLSAGVPDLLRRHLRPFLESWLAGEGLSVAEIPSWAIHPGGPRVISTIAECLGLTPEQTAASRAVLSDHGNMSSPTVLFILERLQRGVGDGGTGPPAPRPHPRPPPRPVVALAFGPGLVAEAALLG